MDVLILLSEEMAEQKEFLASSVSQYSLENRSADWLDFKFCHTENFCSSKYNFEFSEF